MPQRPTGWGGAHPWDQAVYRINAAEEAARGPVAQRLRQIRQAQGQSQSAVARGISKKPSVVSEWEAGVRRVGMADSWVLERHFGLARGTLLGPPTGLGEEAVYDRLLAEAERLRART